MKNIEGIPFPENHEEARTWRPSMKRAQLARKVVAVAQTRVEGTWEAFIDGVPGHDESLEWPAVLAHGVRLNGNIAAAIFPVFSGLPYAGM